MSEPDVTVRIADSAREVLNRRRLAAEGCFGTDVAAIELTGYGPAALPVIEELIRAEVVPAAARGLSRHDLETEFLGLRGLWIEYLELAGRDHGSRAAAFLRTLDGALPVSAAVAAQTAFRSVRKQWSDLEIPRELWEFFDGLRARASGDDRALLDPIVEGFYRATSAPGGAG